MISEKLHVACFGYVAEQVLSRTKSLRIPSGHKYNIYNTDLRFADLTKYLRKDSIGYIIISLGTEPSPISPIIHNMKTSPTAGFRTAN
ncbi:hypothetical protein TWF103_009195 [Orbilia oligospora]|nr:hypothetical protein TWF103_009195 [Orbilia oligospora]